MNYLTVYNSIIEKSKCRVNDMYVEKHHIIPKCIGGNNNSDNLVSLTYREHFICHWLLCKIYPDNYKLKAAFAKMLESNKNNKRITSSYMFDAVKRNLKDTQYPWLRNLEPWNKGKKGLQVPWNKGIKTGPATEERKKKSSETLKKKYKTLEHHRKNKSPWNKGKKGLQVPWNKGIETVKEECPHCNKMVDRLNMKKWHGDKCKLSPLNRSIL